MEANPNTLPNRDALGSLTITAADHVRVRIPSEVYASLQTRLTLNNHQSNSQWYPEVHPIVDALQAAEVSFVVEPDRKAYKRRLALSGEIQSKSAMAATSSSSNTSPGSLEIMGSDGQIMIRQPFAFSTKLVGEPGLHRFTRFTTMTPATRTVALAARTPQYRQSRLQPVSSEFVIHLPLWDVPCVCLVVTNADSGSDVPIPHWIARKRERVTADPLLCPIPGLTANPFFCIAQFLGTASLPRYARTSKSFKAAMQASVLWTTLRFGKADSATYWKYVSHALEAGVIIKSIYLHYSHLVQCADMLFFQFARAAECKLVARITSQAVSFASDVCPELKLIDPFSSNFCTTCTTPRCYTPPCYACGAMNTCMGCCYEYNLSRLSPLVHYCRACATALFARCGGCKIGALRTEMTPSRALPLSFRHEHTEAWFFCARCTSDIPDVSFGDDTCDCGPDTSPDAHLPPEPCPLFDPVSDDDSEEEEDEDDDPYIMAADDATMEQAAANWYDEHMARMPPLPGDC